MRIPLLILALLIGVVTCKSKYAVQQVLTPASAPGAEVKPDEVIDTTLKALADLMTIELSGTTVSEQNGQVTASITLKSAPKGVVTLSVRSAIDNKLSFDPRTLTFSPENWNVAQKILIIGLPDPVDGKDNVVSVIFDSSASVDPIFKVLKSFAADITVVNVPGTPSLALVEGSGWKWTTGGSGSGTVIYALDDTSIDSGTETTDKEIFPTLSRGVHVISVREVDNSGRKSDVAKSIIIINSPVQALPTSGDTAALAEGRLLINNLTKISGEVPPGIPGRAVTITWTLKSIPSGSAATLQPGATAGTPTILPDLPGTYTIERLVVYEGLETRTTLSFIVEGFGAAVMVRASVTGDHTCAVSASGIAYCWGLNDRFQLGIDFAHGGTDSHNHQNTLRPERVAGLTGVSDIALGGSHTCALLTGGTVRCWGDHQALQLGSFSGATRTATPQTINGVTGATAVAAGKFHSCAVLSDKTAKCWGEGSLGELGNGAGTDSAAPVLVSGLSAVEEAACGNGFCCARLSSKAAKCWGRGDLGQLGNGSTANKNAPASVKGISTAVKLGVGDSHACVVLDDGGVYCWGQGVKHQLGNGSQTNSLVPTHVTNY